DREALLLESNLIKTHNPKYNVLLKDGKNYPLLRINMDEKYPNIQRVRKIANDGALYFGPYSSSNSVNQTLKQIQKVFQLRKCKDTQFKNRSRPCLNYQIKACLGLCCKEVDEVEYKARVRDAILFLKGKSRQVLGKLKEGMKTAAAAQNFEKAAQLRDAIFAIENIMQRQVVVSTDQEDRDVLGMATRENRAVVTVMIIRAGRLIDTAHYPLELGFKEGDEIMTAFLDQYYEKTQFLPKTILVNRETENMDDLAQSLSHRKGKKVSLHFPMRGEKKRLVELAVVNAEKELEKILLKEKEEQSTLRMLKDLIGMDVLPRRIECYDNSNLAGKDAVSSMVVFTNGRADKANYRKFIIKDIEIPDDYAYMTQVLERRFSKPKEEMPWPDLLVVDGGKGQLGMATAVLESLDLTGKFAVAGLAKKVEEKGEKADKIYLPGRSNPLNTSQSMKALFLLEQVRDEAHRFAITFNRQRREKRGIASSLDGVPGIGPAKKKVLLQHFKGISAIGKSSMDELTSLPGISPALAKRLLESLGS
ncbi:MAG: excinuclease ABC subunit UvrC, partial [Desulfobacterales bacterium]|nr:excinuclease ABC subunit UvrC [Desulfobacterales bacterium]